MREDILRKLKASAAEDRVEWIDHAKGICIFAVVMMYAAHHVQQIANDIGWMQAAVDFSKPFRMPDFFLLSGLFVAHVLGRTWRSYLDTKVLYFAYFYAVWVTIKFVFMQYSQLLAGDIGRLVPDYLMLFVQPPTGPLWFIYILSLLFVVVRLIRTWPAPLVFALGAALQIADFDTGIILLDKFAHYFIFFYSGYFLAPHIFRLAAWAQERKREAALLLLAWFIANAVLVHYDLAMLPVMSLVTGYAGAIAVMLVSALLVDRSWMSWLSYLGRHSIIVYLGFVIPLALSRPIVARSLPSIDTGTATLFVTLVSIAGAVVLHRAVRGTPLRFLFVRPSWVTTRPRVSSPIRNLHG
ncbi:MAG TPA: acyltransferase family protein [Noviherbaspirillum sp.]|jgi:uncharacterized membrane protein YcfT|uniref:acyltransferase family protein n=1 Tax=Noviherbaspirillum sp. TaxID=1926288 RepID=UPI002F933D64